MAHLLSRLELNGFKSFAQRTTFDLSHGITAIVGPNGSGKSNIIDAIRWLLGEREAKNLRGGKGEDLIFAGTPKRPRLGQAQASIYFDNANQFFPVEFNEVAVTRQVNRDGSNQYFLNKAEIRLKDLIDFFAKARLGTKGLVVVTQGNSDVFITATPAVRREMVEEMLGLREYQLKKAEAERRLKNTQINLDKVRALIEEILPHLRSLKRQTGRWERRGALEEELRGLENEFFGGEYRGLRHEMDELGKEIDGRRETAEQLARERDAATEELKRVEAAQPEERKELEEVKKQTQELFERRSRLQKDVGRLEAQIEHLASRPDTNGRGDEGGGDNHLPAAGVLHQLLKEIKNKLEMICEEDIDYEDLRGSLHEIIENIDEVFSEGSLARKTDEEESESLNRVRSEFEAVNRDLEELEKQIAELKEREQALEQGQEEFYTKFKAAVAAVEAAKEKFEKWETETREKNFARERLNLRLEEWERQVRQANRNPDEFRSGGESPASGMDRNDVERRIFKLRGDLAAIGEVDEGLLKEARETEERYTFLSTEIGDLEKAKNDLHALIVDLNEKIKREFAGALQHINTEFNKFVDIMFGGGTARLKLELPRVKKETPEEAADMPAEAEVQDAVPDELEESAKGTEEGLEIEIKLTRKRVSSLEMLSGGERSLVGIAALFALVSVSPPPFLVLDEVDAPLDERNARRFSEMLKEFSKSTQFILVTHNRATMEAADVLYGITLNDDGTSKAVSLKLEQRA